MRVKPTGSKLHRVWQCPASAVLPQNINDEREARTEPARGRGHIVHRYLERVRLVGPEEALADAIEEVRKEFASEMADEIIAMLRALDLGNLPVHLSTEVAFAYELVTGAVRELGRNMGHRDYHTLENPPEWPEIPLTLDVIGVQTMPSVKGDEFSLGVVRGYVGDYKTGRTRYPPPDKYAQTLLGALCVRAAYGCDEVIVELMYIDEDGDHYPVRRTVDSWDLDMIAADFAEIPGRISAAEVEFLAGRPLPTHEGAHCDYCPSYKSCPAKLGLAMSMPAELIRMGATPALDEKFQEIIGLAPGVITRENAGAIFLAAERFQAFLGLVKTEICNLGWHEPVPLPDGRVIEPVKSSRRALDGRAAAQFLERRYGREEALSFVEIDVTMDALRRAVSKHKAPGQKIETKRGDGVLDLALKELAASGGVSVNTTETCKPRMPRRTK